MSRRFVHLPVQVAILLVGGLAALGDAPVSSQANPPLERIGGSLDFCPPLDPPSGAVVAVSNEAELRHQALNAQAGTTILVASGLYDMLDYVYVKTPGISLRGGSGDPDDVVLDFGGMATGAFGILVSADDVTIADLTIRNAHDHGVAIQGSDRPTLYNLHIQDTANPLVKVNSAGDGSEDGLLACSILEYTTTALGETTHGISAHNAHRWTVRDNVWYRIRPPPNNTMPPTILFWSGSSDTLVERNLLVDCGRGIAFGIGSQGTPNHIGGIVRNNFIYASMPHDLAIEMNDATGWLVAHNTALLLDPIDGLDWGMEARFPNSVGTYANNLTNLSIKGDRDGAQATLTGNLTHAASSWFVDPGSADLHLNVSATAAMDQATSLPEVPADIDGDIRPQDEADIGADEYMPEPSPELLCAAACAALALLSRLRRRRV